MTLGFVLDENVNVENIENVENIYDYCDKIEVRAEVIVIDIRKNVEEKNEKFIYNNISRQAALKEIAKLSTKKFIMYPGFNILKNSISDILDEIETEELDAEDFEDIVIFDYNNFCIENMLFKVEKINKAFLKNKEALLTKETKKIIDINLFFSTIIESDSLRITELFYLYENQKDKVEIEDKQELYNALKKSKKLVEKVLSKASNGDVEALEVFKIYFEKIINIKSDKLSEIDFVNCLTIALGGVFMFFVNSLATEENEILYRNIEHINSLRYYDEENKIYIGSRFEEDTYFYLDC